MMGYLEINEKLTIGGFYYFTQNCIATAQNILKSPSWKQELFDTKKELFDSRARDYEGFVNLLKKFPAPNVEDCCS